MVRCARIDAAIILFSQMNDDPLLTLVRKRLLGTIDPLFTETRVIRDEWPSYSPWTRFVRLLLLCVWGVFCIWVLLYL
jgi:hypothetical protein